MNDNEKYKEALKNAMRCVEIDTAVGIDATPEQEREYYENWNSGVYLLGIIPFYRLCDAVKAGAV